MRRHDATKPTIDPRQFLTVHGREAFAKLLQQEQGYVPQETALNDFVEAVFSEKPLLAEGPRGCGKTAFAEAVSRACNLPTFFIQMMTGIGIEDVLYAWDTTAQRLALEFGLRDGAAVADIPIWTPDYLILGDVLGAYDYAYRHQCPTLLVVDEIDKADAKLEDMLLQVFDTGVADIPRLGGQVGRVGPSPAPIVYLTSNNLRHDLSAPLRSRCLFTFFELPTEVEEIGILRARVPESPVPLLSQTIGLWHAIRRDQSISDRPGLREIISFLKALCKKRVERITEDILRAHLCHLFKRAKDRALATQAVKRYEMESLRPNLQLLRSIEAGLAA